ncbi:MAG: tetratricopeptide repeat protein [Calothrix sp. SM1_7_51]|nr:tetratricopeptide repeat protein [Calothrix sp. SM1_7_51]
MQCTRCKHYAHQYVVVVYDWFILYNLDYADSLHCLAYLYNNQGKYDEAEPLYRQALDIYEQRLGSNHPRTNNCRQNLENLRSKMNSNNLWSAITNKISSFFS